MDFMRHGETVHSTLPWDLPWWMPDHAIFFGVLYGVLAVIGLGVAWVIAQSVLEAAKDDGHSHH